MHIARHVACSECLHSNLLACLALVRCWHSACTVKLSGFGTILDEQHSKGVI
jgi:hypothetical protein